MDRMGSQRRGLTAREWLLAIGTIVAVNGLGAAPALLVGADTSWIDRPWFFPPEILFPIVWTLLFTLMGVALFAVWRAGSSTREGRVAIAAFGGQFVLNLAWTPIFFGFRRPGLGLLVIGALCIAVAVTIAAFNRVSRLAAILLLPYLGWVSFAFVLNYAIYAG
jgi:tryptophan-rich sensory protein